MVYFCSLDNSARFTLQFTHHRDVDYAEVVFRSVAYPSLYLVQTSEGIRMDEPINGNYTFRSPTWITFPGERNRGMSFYYTNSDDQKCYVAFEPDGTQTATSIRCSSEGPEPWARLIGIEYYLDNNANTAL